jgi:hypothetical protein
LQGCAKSPPRGGCFRPIHLRDVIEQSLRLISKYDFYIDTARFTIGRHRRADPSRHIEHFAGNQSVGTRLQTGHRCQAWNAIPQSCARRVSALDDPAAGR